MTKNGISPLQEHGSTGSDREEGSGYPDVGSSTGNVAVVVVVLGVVSGLAAVVVSGNTAGEGGLLDGGGEGAVVLDGARAVGGGVLVDDHDHTALAVTALGAVEPDGAGVVDHDAVDGDLTRLHGVHGGDVASVDTDGRSVNGRDGSAGLVEGGLGDGVVSSHELELDHGADGGGDLVGREEGSGGTVGVHTDEDGDDLDRRGGTEEGGGDDRLELHCERVLNFSILGISGKRKKKKNKDTSKRMDGLPESDQSSLKE